MVTKLFRADRITDGVERNRECALVEGVDRHSAIDEAHIAALAGRRRIARILFGQLAEISAGAELLHEILGLRLCCCVHIRSCIGIDLDQDMKDVRRLRPLVIFLRRFVALFQFPFGRDDLRAKAVLVRSDTSSPIRMRI